MKDYLNYVLNSCERVVNICSSIIEEVNDGSDRSSLVLSSCEALYSLQDLVRAYVRMYPNEFDKSLQRKVKRFLKSSLQRWLNDKLSIRHNIKPCEFDDLPF